MRYKLLIACWLWASSTTADEKFLPDGLERAKVMACGIGGNPDKTTDAFVIVQFSDGSRDFRPLIAREQDLLKAADDCIKWWQDVKGRWRVLRAAAEKRSK